MNQFHHWKIGTINVRTASDDQKLEKCIEEIHNAGLSICALQETRRLGKGSGIISSTIENITNDYEIHWSGHLHKRTHGVSIAIKVDPNIEIIEVTPINARLIILDVNVYGCYLKVIGCYAPTEEDSESAKTSFYNLLQKHVRATQENQKVICLGDFNATSSAFWYNSSLRENSVIPDLVVNNNGERFHEFFNTCHLSVLNTWYNYKRCRRVTWYSPDGVTQKVYDFVLIDSWLRQYAKNCRVYRSFDFDSDHRLVIATLDTPCTKQARYRIRKRKSGCTKFDMNSF
ncbi:craniofacial development protein 2-like [Clytia hemisphaerica]|uniref:craniofacial development protein 2-like n=1 Tax=Clytia hemisphaerica TaxID=252671 RepID=UPI0034D467B0